MPEESTTPDLVELTREHVQAIGRADIDAIMSAYAPTAAGGVAGIGTQLEGVAAIRAFWEDWIGGYEEFEAELLELLDLGSGVVFGVMRHTGRPRGSTGQLTMVYAGVNVWVDGLIVEVRSYLDIDEARAAAERLAQERR
jgi:ketosteroid isomerase-like protein